MSGKSKLDAGRNWPHWMIGFWISLCALLQVAGWGLSAVGQLNAAGYAGVLGAAAVVAILFYRNRIAALRLSALGLRKLVRRFHRLWPLTFLLIAGLITLGAMLHPPNNYDALSYRIPRVLNWLAENRWHWIHTQDARMNVRACGNEWLLAPLLALTGTDRWIFIINLISYLLIPSLLFGVYT
ncbi:MAG: hypothetical protein N3B01_12615, partial [Verrucomicrobiae bacterium]|nr:hypothetical protein [Verrucomicrobiae bacterium]